VREGEEGEEKRERERERREQERDGSDVVGYGCGIALSSYSPSVKGKDVSKEEMKKYHPSKSV
jgi:hypothetical protein